MFDFYLGLPHILYDYDRKWNEQLDNHIKTLGSHLEEECDAYFEKIQKDAIKVKSCLDLCMQYLIKVLDGETPCMAFRCKEKCFCKITFMINSCNIKLNHT